MQLKEVGEAREADPCVLWGIREVIMGGDVQSSLNQPLAQKGHHGFVQSSLETIQGWRYCHLSEYLL